MLLLTKVRSRKEPGRLGWGEAHLVLTIKSETPARRVSGDRNVTSVYLLLGVPNLDQRE